MTKLILLLLCLILFSCDNDKNTNYQSEETKKFKQDSIENVFIANQIQKIVAENNIKFSWDTMKYEYSIQYDSILNSEKQVIRVCIINDIFKSDSLIVIKARCGTNPYFYFYLSTSNTFIIKELLNKQNKRFHDLLFVVKINRIKKILFDFVYNDREDGEYVEYSMDLQDSDCFVGYGELLDIKQISKLE